MVDTAIAAMADWAASGLNANSGGAFAAADACDALLERTRATVATLLGATPDAVCFGANMTTLTLAFTRAVALTLRPGDRVVGTRIDHDANVTPWRLACEASGAEHVLAPFDPRHGCPRPGGRDRAHRRAHPLGRRHRRVQPAGHDPRPRPDRRRRPRRRRAGLRRCRAPRPAPAHRLRRARLRRPGDEPVQVVRAPRRRARRSAAAPRRAARRPGPAGGGRGPRRWETGTPSFEAIAAVDAAAQFLLAEGMDRIAAREAAVFSPLLDGLAALHGIQVWGPRRRDAARRRWRSRSRAGIPTRSPRPSPRDRIATWAGHSYAVEVVDQLGLADKGGVVRAGVVAYIEPDDVARLLDAVGAEARAATRMDRRRRCGRGCRRRAVGSPRRRRSSRSPGSPGWLR